MNAPYPVLTGNTGVRILRFDTSQETPEQIAKHFWPSGRCLGPEA